MNSSLRLAKNPISPPERVLQMVLEVQENIPSIGDIGVDGPGPLVENKKLKDTAKDTKYRHPRHSPSGSSHLESLRRNRG